MRCLVVGYGSIGSRHSRLLSELGHEVEAVSRNEACPFPRHTDIDSALSATNFDLVIVANRTCEHLDTLKQLDKRSFQGSVLVEKPVFDKTVESKFPNLADGVYVAYNFRFHPILQDVYALLQGVKVLSAQFYVGQYLPDWRPGTDYSDSYSASRDQGGGVLRDLSHELDMACWLLGTWQSVTALGGRFSELRIDSDDTFALLMSTERCPVLTVQMNYLDRKARRELVMHTDKFSIKADLINGTLDVDGDRRNYDIERDVSYRAQLKTVLDNPSDPMLCSLEDGINVLRLIEAAELASSTLTWVKS